MKKLVIAIDGPSGAGKGTLARTIAERLGYKHVDTGAMYRAVAWKAAQDGVPLDDDAAVAAVARRAVYEQADGKITHRRPRCDARDPHARGRQGGGVSGAARRRCAKCWSEQQRDLGRERGVVMEGRDIGTVVFPNADLKFYIDADPEERARRRAGDSAHTGGQASLAFVQSELVARDTSDSTRAVAPLSMAPDAIYIDTTTMPIEVVVNHVMIQIMDKLDDLVS